MYIRRLGVIVTILLVAVGPLRGDDPKKGESVKKDKAKIQGTWKLASLEADGVEGPPEVVAAMRLSSKHDKLVFLPGEPGFTKFTFKLDPTTKPPSIDMTHADGADKGKATKGIYAWEGDTLKICVGEEKRPKDFTAKADSGPGNVCAEARQALTVGEKKRRVDATRKSRWSRPIKSNHLRLRAPARNANDSAISDC